VAFIATECNHTSLSVHTLTAIATKKRM
jgi:hypothetical protein